MLKKLTMLWHLVIVFKFKKFACCVFVPLDLIVQSGRIKVRKNNGNIVLYHGSVLY